MKVLFLDIDGVIQLSTEHRFNHSKEEIYALCHDLTEKFGGIFDYTAWVGDDSGGNPFWTVAAVQWDWNPEIVGELKRVLDTTGAKIVLSSAWRHNGNEAMRALFRIWQLDSYYLDSTMPEDFWDSRDKAKSKLENQYEKYLSNGKKYLFVDRRSFEILEWLDRHPEVTSYAIVDDYFNIYGHGDHFVLCEKGLKKDLADKLIAALQIEDGPYCLPKEIHSMPELAIVRSKKSPKENR